MKEFTNRIPKAIWNEGFVLFEVEVFGPFLYCVFAAALSILLTFDMFEVRSAERIYYIGDYPTKLYGGG